MPVSLIANSNRIFSCVCSRTFTCTFTLPFCVNLIALPVRLMITCVRRMWSPTTTSGTSSSQVKDNSRFCSFALPVSITITDCKVSRTLKVCASIAIMPASIFDISRMSLMLVSRFSPADFMVFTNSFSSAPSFLLDNRSEKPMMAFMGVRISWLILARKASFNLPDSSAFSVACSAVLLASINSFSNLFCSVISLATTTAPNTFPLSSL